MSWWRKGEHMNENNIIIYSTEDGRTSVSLLAKDGTTWLSQSQIAELFATTKQNISLHIQNIFEFPRILD